MNGYVIFFSIIALILIYLIVEEIRTGKRDMIRFLLELVLIYGPIVLGALIAFTLFSGQAFAIFVFLSIPVIYALAFRERVSKYVEKLIPSVPVSARQERRQKISFKHVVLILIGAVVLYNIFFPDDFIQKTLYPQEYWSERVESLRENINFLEKSIYDLSKEMTTKNYNREVREMALDFMKEGMPQDSSLKLAMEISKSSIKSEKLVLESFTKSLQEHRYLLEKAKSKLRKIEQTSK